MPSEGVEAFASAVGADPAVPSGQPAPRERSRYRGRLDPAAHGRDGGGLTGPDLLQGKDLQPN